jgi:hypothetical protein
MKPLTLFALLLRVTRVGGQDTAPDAIPPPLGQHDSFCDYSECSIERIGQVVLHRGPIQRRPSA